ncbi:type II toxin-antitoxin system Phd/YefM family antitoxin [Cyanobium sp. WAJ14-Wanaka]|uniref:type II toxin-antitoxin system Phd/YefM family antitoxin n=1 Tax=Cyanobium sp. WAJ14-Wanaka TaxID=2823725 RepID=UPI0020CCC392|nr:type II toxin-antitoxin system prevent-host-death family antitoxin [Cyanobium sp. WAJ14-Wanaka]
MNLHDAKTHLSRYVEQALVRLVPVDETPRKRELGFLQGAAVLDCELKADFQKDIEAMFG